MKKPSTFLLLGSTLFFLGGCSLMQLPTTPPAKQSFSFDYKASAVQKPGSAGTVLALVKPNYGNNFKLGDNELFSRLRLSMAADVEELLIDKGFTIKSDQPFESLDDMIYDDKKVTDMAIRIELNPEFDGANGDWKTNYNLLGGPMTYSYSGTVSLIGKVNLTGIEPLSGQKIWSKSVNLPEIRNIAVRTQLVYASTSSNEILLFNDPGIYNAIGVAFAAQYEAVMNKIAAHFNPEEFRALKSQIKELKTKKTF